MDKIIFALNLIVDLIDTTELITEKNISDYLYISGFDDHEVRQVLALLDISHYSSITSFRAFTKLEKRVLSQEVQNYLNKLILLGILDIFVAEEIIEKAFNYGNYQMPIERVKELVLYSILDRYTSTYKDGSNTEDYIQ